ncbi:Ig-like domain-containing protein [uncultured Methylobacterium sp.]|uniref:Ig-like domain-containing protein n=1 Tax=uncultured Methylobacterium sp. TaxID=157278 RepID=UPI0035CBBB29
MSVQFANGLSHAVPASGTVQVFDPNGALTLSADGSYSYRPTGSGHAVFTETVADAAGNPSQTTLTLDVAKAAIPAALSFAFALTDARFDFSHGHALMTAPDGTLTDLTGVGTIAFTDGTVPGAGRLAARRRPLLRRPQPRRLAGACRSRPARRRVRLARGPRCSSRDAAKAPMRGDEAGGFPNASADGR